MALLAQNTAFTAADLDEFKTGTQIATYTATAAILLDIYILAGKTGGLLDGNAATLTASAILITNSDTPAITSLVGGGLDSVAHAKVVDASTSEYIYVGRIYLRATDVLNIILDSTNAGDGDVDGNVFFVNPQAAIDVELIGSATPEKFTDSPSGGQGSRDNLFSQHGRY